MFEVPERYRVITGTLASSKESDGNNGMFKIPKKAIRNPWEILVVASDGGGWEHVSASIKGMAPLWETMCSVKDLFWGPDDWVVQYHPGRSDYVNCHPYCLHLWRPSDGEFPKPPSWMVGPKVKV